MSLSGVGVHRDPMTKKTLYLLTEKTFNVTVVHELDDKRKTIAKHKRLTDHRVGNCWMKDRLKPGDIVLVDELSGDCFYDCYLIDHTDYSNHEGVNMRIIPASFGMYAFEAVQLVTPSKRDYHLLLAGEEVEINVKLPK